MSHSSGPPLPRDWPRRVRSAVLHVISLALTAIACARAKAATSRRSVDRLRAELERAGAEASLLREELRIKDARLGRLAPRRRPHYRPTERLRSTSIPFRRDDMRRHVGSSVAWFHEWRPHQGLGGRTPNEVYRRKKRANTKPRIELRPRKVSRLTLSVKFVDGHRQLPVEDGGESRRQRDDLVQEGGDIL